MKQFPFVSFHYKGSAGIPIKGEVTNHNLMIFDGSEVLHLEFNDGTWGRTQGPDTP